MMYTVRTILILTLWMLSYTHSRLHKRPINIGHRGSCGIFPEHTVASFRQAVEDGADMIECDITITKDLQLVCRHENWLSGTTDVAQHPEFQDKISNRLVEGVNLTDWFAVDFTLEELRQLYAKQVLSFRDQSFNDIYPVATLDEFIQIARSAGRHVGIYPEIKTPHFINSLDIFPVGKRFEDIVVEELKKHGYSEPDDGCILQSFEEESLRYIQQDLASNLPLAIMHEVDVDDVTLNRWADLGFVAIGFWKDQVFQHYINESYKHRIAKTTDLIEKIQARGLEAHVFTFRNEDEYLPWEDAQDPYLEYERFLKKGPDAYFTDFPATFKRLLDSEYIDNVWVNSGVNVKASVWCLLVIIFVKMF